MRIPKGDPLRPGQILINFCNNAVKLTERGEIAITARVQESDDKGQLVHFAVRDTGIGLTQEQMGRLFQSIRAGRCLNHASARRHGLGAGDLQTVGAADGVATWAFASQVGQGSTPLVHRLSRQRREGKAQSARLAPRPARPATVGD